MHTRKNIRRGRREETRDEEEARVCRDKKGKKKREKRERERDAYTFAMSRYHELRCSLCVYIYTEH